MALEYLGTRTLSTSKHENTVDNGTLAPSHAASVVVHVPVYHITMRRGIVTPNITLPMDMDIQHLAFERHRAEAMTRRIVAQQKQRSQQATDYARGLNLTPTPTVPAGTTQVAHDHSRKFTPLLMHTCCGLRSLNSLCSLPSPSTA